jgi:iron(III) transport system substrate-binding protein
MLLKPMIVFYLVLGLNAPTTVFAAALPKSTLEILKKLRLDASILAETAQELEVPKEWIENARKERKLRWRSTTTTPEELKVLLDPFRERYPFIEVEFSGTSQQERSVKTLVAYRAGRILGDVLTSIGGFVAAYKQADALEDLTAIPNFHRLPKEAKDPEGLWTGINQNYWCMSYNTRLVKRADLPARWEDLLTNPRWRGGNLALGNRPQVWALNVWHARGEAWTKNFLTRLFTEVKPQRRKEGLSALAQLVAAGEFHAAIPSNYKEPHRLALAGASVAFTCPEPVPASVEDTVILKRSPNIHAAKIFVNWLLSKEGQIAQYAFEFAAPLDKDLRPKLLPFADQILGKKESFREASLEQEIGPKLFDFWNPLWLRVGAK